MEWASTLFSSPALIDELAHTLNYPKFSQRIAAHCATTPSALTVRYGALAANAHLIVSGNKHLHSLGGAYQGVRIVTAAEAIRAAGAK